MRKNTFVSAMVAPSSKETNRRGPITKGHIAILCLFVAWVVMMCIAGMMS